MRSRWTNHEVRRLRELFEICRRPTDFALSEAIPRHPPQSTMKMAKILGLVESRDNFVPFERTRHWLRVTHEHFSRRESGLLS
jgi:hypothetical protein